MKCIHCAHKKTEVTNSREAKKGLVTWRRRSCPKCGRTFTTTESGRADNLFVIKSSGSRQRFVYEKLFVSLFCVFSSKKHHDNGDDALLSKKIAERIIGKMLAATDPKNIRTSEIIILAYMELKKIDRALADDYIHYSSYRRKVGAKASLI